MLGPTTPRRVRTGRTIGDYSLSAWTFGTSQAETMRHHSCGPRPSPTVPGRPPSSPAVLTHARPSPTVPCRPHQCPAVPTVPGRPHPSPAVLNSPRPSSPISGRPDSSPAVSSRPSPLSCTNMSHPVGPAVLPKDGRPALTADGTDYS